MFQRHGVRGETRWCKLILLILLTVSIGALAQGASSNNPWKSTNDKSKIAVNRDPDAVGTLADDVIAGSIVLENLGAANSDLRSTLILSQLDYLNGKHAGISESDVVITHNSLAHLASAPAFAYTDKWEVRRLRMRLLSVVPGLFTQDIKREKQGKFAIREEMSPIEATYLLARLIDAKLNVPEFQLTASERRAKWSELHSKPAELAAGPNARTKQIMDSAKLAANNGSFRDLGAITETLIQNLGLRRKGGR